MVTGGRGGTKAEKLSGDGGTKIEATYDRLGVDFSEAAHAVASLKESEDCLLGYVSLVHDSRLLSISFSRQLL
ncbi:hypothetical protein HPP92_016501 [Vanilla planifolia]|uniref:Uncharacterized protein n=1 Tax=Vanilla planifolia TaxID=51239 RepID=A0A835UTE7_VANPL|nr:hypothetical protein HPP92_016501 [Vanilla planifolia]